MNEYQAVIEQAEKLKKLSEQLTEESLRVMREKSERYQQTMRDAKVKVHVGGSTKSDK